MGGYLQKDADSLNVALSNAHSYELWMEIEELQKQSRAVPDFDRRWKLLTIFIGFNDICDGLSSGFEACDGKRDHMITLADRYEANLRAALVTIRDIFSRIVVQLVSLFSLASVKWARAGYTWCKERPHLLVECNCLDKPVSAESADVSAEQLNWLDASVHAFNDKIHKLAVEFNLQRPDFAVIEAVTGRSQHIPDITYLSEFDCFHPSSMAHGAVATALWNSLFDHRRAPAPLASSQELFCPTSDSVINIGESEMAWQGPSITGRATIIALAALGAATIAIIWCVNTVAVTSNARTSVVALRDGRADEDGSETAAEERDQLLSVRR